MVLLWFVMGWLGLEWGMFEMNKRDDILYTYFNYFI